MEEKEKRDLSCKCCRATIEYCYFTKETVADTVKSTIVRQDTGEVFIPVIVPYCNKIPTGKEISPALLSIHAEYDYYPLPTNEITIFVTNKSSKEYTCGDEYSIAYYNEKTSHGNRCLSIRFGRICSG